MKTIRIKIVAAAACLSLLACGLSLAGKTAQAQDDAPAAESPETESAAPPAAAEKEPAEEVAAPTAGDIDVGLRQYRDASPEERQQMIQESKAQFDKLTPEQQAQLKAQLQEQMQERYKNMSPDQLREEARDQYQALTPEQKAQARAQIQTQIQNEIQAKRPDLSAQDRQRILNRANSFLDGAQVQDNTLAPELPDQ